MPYGYYGGYGERVDITRSNFEGLCRPKIELNGNYIGTEFGFLLTLIHEMCHYYTYMYGRSPKQAHGPQFRNICEIVSIRSKGKYTIEKIATSEQMNNLELNDEMKAKKEKRLENKKASVSAIVVFRKNGVVALTISSNKPLIKTIKSSAEDFEEKYYISNDSDVIEYLFSKGYRKNMRTWRYWHLEDKPWLNEFESLISGNNASSEEEPQPVKTNEPKKIFTIKTSTGLFECGVTSYYGLVNAIKKRFPNMSDETIDKIINNPSNYRMTENRRTMKEIIKEVIDEFIENEESVKNHGNVITKITPDMNLGQFSPMEL